MQKTFKPFLLLFCLSISFFSIGQNVGDPAPNFSLEKLGGGQFTLSSQEGKVVFIFLFGYSCPHCLANGPNTQSGIYEVFAGDPDFVAVGVDTWDGNEAGVESFKSSTGVGYQLCLKGSGLEDSYNSTYDRIIVVDQNGIIQYKATANATASVVNQAKSVIESLLAEGGDDDDKMDDDMMKENMITGLSDTDNYQSATEIFPNPARDVLNIEASSFEGNELDVRIFDTTGKKAFKGKIRKLESDFVQVPVEQLRNGLYILQVESTGQKITRKFLVMK